MNKLSIDPRLVGVVVLLFAANACGDDDPSTSGADSAADSTSSDPDPDTGNDSNPNPETSGESTGEPSDDTTGGPEDTTGDSGGETAAAGCTPPTAWAAPNWAANTTAALALRAQLDAIDTAINASETATAAPADTTELTGLFEAGDPSLASVTTAAYTAVVLDAFGDLVALPAGTTDLIDATPAWAPGAAGGFADQGVNGQGVAVVRAMNAGGLELQQVIEKGLRSGAMAYNYGLGLTAGTIDEATIDSLAAIWGANELLANDDLTDAATYSFAMGFFGDMSTALIAAKAFAEDTECEAERDAALVSFFNLWEQSMFARTVYYGNEAANAVELAAAGDDVALIGALHELGEGVGLALGFLGVEAPATGPLSGGARLSTDDHLATLTTSLGIQIADLNASTTGTFVGNLPAFRTAITEIETLVGTIFGLDAAEVAAFRMESDS